SEARAYDVTAGRFSKIARREWPPTAATGWPGARPPGRPARTASAYARRELCACSSPESSSKRETEHAVCHGTGVAARPLLTRVSGEGVRRARRFLPRT